MWTLEHHGAVFPRAPLPGAYFLGASPGAYFLGALPGA